MEKYKFVIPYIVIFVMVIIIRSFIVTPIQVVGPSMQNTLHEGDIMFLNKISYSFQKIKRFDIVVIKTTSHPIIKRIIGLPGEEVYIKNGDVYINEQKLEQTFDYNKSGDSFTLADLGYIRIPKGMYFVLGDNRDQSADSRTFGLVKRDYIVGKTHLILYPFNRFGNVK